MCWKLCNLSSIPVKLSLSLSLSLFIILMTCHHIYLHGVSFLESETSIESAFKTVAPCNLHQKYPSMVHDTICIGNIKVCMTWL
jgi:hypothetical protein